MGKLIKLKDTYFYEHNDDCDCSVLFYVSDNNYHRAIDILEKTSEKWDKLGQDEKGYIGSLRDYMLDELTNNHIDYNYLDDEPDYTIDF